MFLRKIHNGYLSLWEGDNNESNFADELENFEKGAKTQKHLQKSFFKNNLVLLSTAKKKKKKKIQQHKQQHSNRSKSSNRTKIFKWN